MLSGYDFDAYVHSIGRRKPRRLSACKIINDVVEFYIFFAKHLFNSILLEIVNRHALSYVLVQVTANAPLVRVKLVRVTDNVWTQTRTRTRVYVNAV